jgi:diguanylate cyclase (GGDEF)-like protein
MKILIAESDPQTRETLSSTLVRWGYTVRTVANGDEVLSALREKDGPKFAIVSRTLGGGNGLEVCRKIRKDQPDDYIYLFILTGDDSASAVAEAAEAGADDWLRWPLVEDEARMRLRAARRILGLRYELEEARAALRYQVSHDPLTGVMNRAAILDALRRELARVRREKSPVGVIKVQIDNFREMNRKFGSAAGDAAIRSAARKLRAAVRPYDSIGRLGIENFLILVPGSDIRETLTQAERLRVAVASEPLQVAEWGRHASLDQSSLATTISLGVAASSQAQDPELLVNAAEAALARARAAGPNRVEMATPQELAGS